MALTDDKKKRPVRTPTPPVGRERGGWLNCRSVVVLGREVTANEVRGHVTTELHAGVGARQCPACDAANVTNPNIFHRRRLPRRKIGRLSGGDGDDAGRGTEQKALNERHL